MAYSPYFGYTPASNMPAYYNPYNNLGGARVGEGPANQTVPGQQAGQRLVPGKDQPTPGSKHGAKGGTVRMMNPLDGSTRMVPATRAAYFEQKGARRV